VSRPTGWTVRGSNPGRGEIFPIQSVSGAHPHSCTIGNGSIPGGVKRPGRDVGHPPLAPRLKEDYSYTSSLPLGFRRLF
jgi:hypothetical protein